NHRQRSLEAALEESSACLEKWLESGEPSPGSGLLRQEQLLCLTDAPARLPEGQPAGIELRPLQGDPVPYIRMLTGRTIASVAGLLRRGLKRLRQLLEEHS